MAEVLEDIFESEVKPVRKVYVVDGNDFKIYGCETQHPNMKKNYYGNYTIKGKLPTLSLGDTYKVKVKETYDDKNGYGYEVVAVTQTIPSDREGQINYLSNVLTEKQLVNLTKAYPTENIIDLFIDDKIEFAKVKGVSKNNYKKLKEKVMSKIHNVEIISLLTPYDIPNHMIEKIVKHYGSPQLTMDKINENPYDLTKVKGISFISADKIAMKLNYNLESPFRIQSGIKHLIQENQKEGHTYITENRLIRNAEKLLEIDINLIHNELDELNDEIVKIGNRYILKKTYDMEKFIASKLLSILSESKPLNFDMESYLNQYDKENEFPLTEQQRQFFFNIQKYNVNVLTGYAGCGKSLMQKILVNILSALGITYRLLCPTGKAAKVLSEYTGDDAETIHRAVGIIQGIDNKHMRKEIEEEFVIIDETSMLDVKLCADLLDSLTNSNVRVLFIGDPFQLAAVGCGNVLHDLIQSNAVPCTELNQVFRQEDGGILEIVTRVRQGEKFVSDDFVGIKKIGSDFIFASVPQEKMERGYKYYYNELLKEYKPENIMLLSPTKKGNLGTFAINNTIQGIVNPKKSNKKEIYMTIEDHNVTFRDGDYVINTKNNRKLKNEYDEDTEIVNGDMGNIKSVDSNGALVNFDFDVIPFDRKLIYNLLHAWCITNHKSQGSAADAVISVVDKSHTYQLTANLLYTSWTRPRKFLVIVCQAATINSALKKFANLQRNTLLCEMLKRCS